MAGALVTSRSGDAHRQDFDMSRATQAPLTATLVERFRPLPLQRCEGSRYGRERLLSATAHGRSCRRARRPAVGSQLGGALVALQARCLHNSATPRRCHGLTQALMEPIAQSHRASPAAGAAAARLLSNRRPGLECMPTAAAAVALEGGQGCFGRCGQPCASPRLSAAYGSGASGRGAAGGFRCGFGLCWGPACALGSGWTRPRGLLVSGPAGEARES